MNTTQPTINSGNNKNSKLPFAIGAGVVAAALGVGGGVLAAKADEHKSQLNEEVNDIDEEKHPADTLDANVSEPENPVVHNHIVHTERIVEVHHHHHNTPGEGTTEDKVEVVGYERITDPDTGEQMDVASLKMNGNEMVFIDVDLDGYADAMAYDVNGDRQLQENEIHDVRDQRISMQPMAEAMGYQLVMPGEQAVMPDDLMAENIIPDNNSREIDNSDTDYTNDADHPLDEATRGDDNEIEIVAVDGLEKESLSYVPDEDITVEFDNTDEIQPIAYEPAEADAEITIEAVEPAEQIAYEPAPEPIAEPDPAPAFDPEPMADPLADNSDFGTDDMHFDDDMMA